jgi:DUF3040 family protein
MSLSAHEQQALDAIEERLTDSDPKLASLLAMFTRLASGEQMPIREKIRAGWERATRRQPAHRRRPRLDRAHCRARQLYRRMGWQRAMLLLWLLTTIALTATALALSRGGGTSTCSQPWPVTCASKPPAHSAARKALGPRDRRREISLGASR